MKKSKNYHHGDIRNSALALCVEKLKKQEQPDLGLRAVARDLGVSSTALYRHFSSKDALLDEVVLIGLDALIKVQTQVTKDAGGGLDGLIQRGIAYVLWSVENPALFKMIFSRLGTHNDAKLSQLKEEALDLLRLCIVDADPNSHSHEQYSIATLQAWSICHGLAQLIVDGVMECDEKTIREVLSTSYVLEGK